MARYQATLDLPGQPRGAVRLPRRLPLCRRVGPRRQGGPPARGASRGRPAPSSRSPRASPAAMSRSSTEPSRSTGPAAVLLVAESSSLVSRDEITVDEYRRRRHRGHLHRRPPPARAAAPSSTPLLQVLFNRIGDNARDGLAEKLAQPLRRSAT